MKKFAALFISAAAACAMFVITTSSPAKATIEIGKKEKKPCTVCHVKMGSKDLNDVGKYYKEKKTLEGAPQKK